LKNWAVLAIALRGRVQRQSGWSKAQQHYANWLLKDEQRLARLVGEAAPIAEGIALTLEQRKQVQNYVRREVRRHRGARSQVRIARSFCLDAAMYRVFEEKERLYIKVMNRKGKERVVIPLTGQHQIAGNIRLVLDRARNRIEVH